MQQPWRISLLLLLLLPMVAWGQALSRREASLLNPLEYGVTCSQTTLQAAISATPASGRVLMLTPVDRDGTACTWTITTNLTVPSQVVLHVPQGVTVAINTGIVLTLARYPREDNRSWKTGAGTLVIQEVHPQTGMVNVKDVGARGDNSTDDRAAIQAAITLVAPTGGTIYFPPGMYYTGTTASSATVTIPIATATWQPQVQAFPYQFLATAIDGLHFVGPGATIRSAYALGGSIFLFDGCRDVTWEGINIQSVTTFDSAGTVSVAGMHALSFTAQTRDSTRLRISNYASIATYSNIYMFGDPINDFRIDDVQLSNLLLLNNYYGLAFHNQGFGVQFTGVRAVGGVRPYFVFGVFTHAGDILVEQGSPDVQGFNAIMIKAYGLNTEDIQLRVSYRRLSTSTKVEFSSQHNVAAQPLPATVRNIVLDYNEVGFPGGGGINFSYYQGPTTVPTSSMNVFDNITIRGMLENDITTSTIFSGAGRVKLNIEDVVFITGVPTILENKGFYQSAYRTYQPALAFGGASTGMVYAIRLGEYFEIGNMVFGSLQIRLTAKGSAVGIATVTLPVLPSNQLAGNVVLHFLPRENMASLFGGFSAWAAAGTIQCLLFQLDGTPGTATGITNLTHSNFTDSSEIRVTFAYSK